MKCIDIWRKRKENTSVLPLETQSLASSAWYARGVVRNNREVTSKNSIETKPFNHNQIRQDKKGRIFPMVLFLLTITALAALAILYGPPCWEIWTLAREEHISQMEFWEPQCRDQTTHRHYEAMGLPHPCDHLEVVKGKDVMLAVWRECWEGLPGLVQDGLVYGIPVLVVVVGPLWVMMAWWAETSKGVRSQWEKYSAKSHIKGSA